VADSEDALQIPVHKLERVTSIFSYIFQRAKRKQWLLKEQIQLEAELK
jgi:hypothetical protein